MAAVSGHAASEWKSGDPFWIIGNDPKWIKGFLT
jgi:hypothetical protein